MSIINRTALYKKLFDATKNLCPITTVQKVQKEVNGTWNRLKCKLANDSEFEMTVMTKIEAKL